jgi:hypothetical protein
MSNNKLIWMIITIFCSCTLILAACSTEQNLTEELGSLVGKVTVGPLTPVERLDATPAPIPPEVYTSRALNIFTPDGKKQIVRRAFNADGTYQIDLPPGDYLVDIEHHGIDSASGMPVLITIHNGEKLILDINIDTGIR